MLDAVGITKLLLNATAVWRSAAEEATRSTHRSLAASSFSLALLLCSFLAAVAQMLLFAFVPVASSAAVGPVKEQNEKDVSIFDIIRARAALSLLYTRQSVLSFARLFLLRCSV